LAEPCPHLGPSASLTPAYADLAAVYEWLTPEPLLTPAGYVAAFAPWIDPLPAGARVLDCAAGVGWLAVGLALRGFAVEATDISPAMIERTRALATEHRVDVAARVCAWEDLSGEPRFDAVFCIGNSLAHAQDRRAALAGMAGVLKPGGLLVLTSRNWERERAAGSRLEIADRIVERHGRPALVTHAWVIPESWTDPHTLEIAVTFVDTVQTVRERLAFWPFTPSELAEDLRACGLEPDQSTFTPEVERYLVSARS
jgi:SAM-dependent methyltransferase